MSHLKEKLLFPMASAPELSLPESLAPLRGDMLRFARLQLRDNALAEDVVQEALLAALEGIDDFKMEAQVKTWVFKILRNKIIDAFRRRRRTEGGTPVLDEIPEGAYDELFDENGNWTEHEIPADWGNPEHAFATLKFWEVFEVCLSRLPENAARAFMMRELLGFDTSEICRELGMSSSNCWVVLYRARMGLRLCLNERWFRGERG